MLSKITGIWVSTTPSGHITPRRALSYFIPKLVTRGLRQYQHMRFSRAGKNRQSSAEWISLLLIRFTQRHKAYGAPVAFPAGREAVPPMTAWGHIVNACAYRRFVSRL